VNATSAIVGTSMPWADSSTICARRQVTTDPLPRRMIRTSRRPSPSSISRTRSRSVTEPVSAISACGESPGGANLTCYGTSSISSPLAFSFPSVPNGSRATSVTSNRHAARLAFQSPNVQITARLRLMTWA
jgi:hypothetical protein